MTRGSDNIVESPTRGGFLDSSAMGLLLASLAGRIVIPELPFRSSPLAGLDSGGGVILPPSHIDLASMTFGVMIFLAGLCWLIGQAGRRSLKIRAGRLGVIIAMFAAWSLASALQGGDQRGALICWTNQVALMLSAWLAIQLCADSKRRAMLLAVLAAMGVMLALVGLRQVFVDAAERIADFEARGAEIFAARGWTPDSPEAISFKERLFKAVPLGFFSLANIFASVMIVLGSAVFGLAADKWRKAIPDRRNTAHLRNKGEIHLPTLSAAITSLAFPLCAAALVLALSRGATGAAVLVGLSAAVVLRFRRRLTGHRRKWMLTAVLVTAALIGAVVACGLKYDSLGAKTMTFRWYYWTASAEIIADEPVWGVGPGGFGPAYEAVRRPAAEEAVKTPHNFAVHAAAQYGLPGAGLYLCVVAMVLWGLCRPASGPSEEIDPTARASAAPIVWIPLTVIASQWLFAGSRGAMLVGAFEAAVFLAVGLAIMLWFGPRLSHAAADGGLVARVVLACGLIGFVAHNTVSFSLWMPGAAMAFWLGAGAVISVTRTTTSDFARFRWPAVGVSVLAIAAVFVLLWLPVARRSWAAERVVERMIARDGNGALDFAEKAARCDTLDHIAAADVAGLLRGGGREHLPKAYDWAKEAIRRCPQASLNHRLAADILWDSGDRGSRWLGHMNDAVKRDPQLLSMRVEFAERLMEIGLDKLAGQQVQAAETINNALAPDSIFKLDPTYLFDLRMKSLKS